MKRGQNTERGETMKASYFGIVLFVSAFSGCGTASPPGDSVSQAAHHSKLPQVLLDRGFGNPEVPVSIVFIYEPGYMKGAYKLAGTNDVPPNNTKWVFQDPRPVWRCFEGVKAKSFHEGAYAPAEASFVLTVGTDDDGDAQVTFHFESGWVTIDSPKGKPEGGDCVFDKQVERRLAQLLTRTPPTELGVPILRGHACKYVGEMPQDDRSELTAKLVRSKEQWQELGAIVKTRYAHLEEAPLPVPEGFRWGTDVAVVAWLPARDQQEALTYHNARLCKGTLRWHLSLRERTGRAEDFSPAVIGFFSPPRKPQQVEIWLDGRVATRLPWL